MFHPTAMVYTHRNLEEWVGSGVLGELDLGSEFCRASASFHFCYLLTQMFVLEQAFHLCHFPLHGKQSDLPCRKLIPVFPSYHILLTFPHSHEVHLPRRIQRSLIWSCSLRAKSHCSCFQWKGVHFLTLPTPLTADFLLLSM